MFVMPNGQQRTHFTHWRPPVEEREPETETALVASLRRSLGLPSVEREAETRRLLGVPAAEGGEKYPPCYVCTHCYHVSANANCTNGFDVCERCGYAAKDVNADRRKMADQIARLTAEVKELNWFKDITLRAEAAKETKG
ncbi:MAG: hypothetical protein WC538_22015 [Thermoanaerobaculia bacterium]|jgi:hypothetical protein